MSVLDASVVLKWFVSEENSDKAIALRSEFYLGTREIVAPDLILYEIANALRYNPDFEQSEIKESIQTIYDMGIEIITPTQTLINKVVDIAKLSDITCYDASYYALAEDIKTDLITADKKLYNNLINNGLKDVLLLKNLKA